MTRRQRLLDVAVALVVFALTVAMLAPRRDGGDAARDPDLLGVLLAAAASLPLVARRRAPLGVFAVTAGASTMLSAFGYPDGPPVGPTVALFFLALTPERATGPRWLAAAVVVGMFVLHLSAGGISEGEFPTVPLLFGALVWGGAWVLGDRIRTRRARVAELEERARRAEAEAQRERRLARAEERMRIARDLHDSAGHAINVILVQAGAARLLQDQDPERSRAALETIEDVARETVGEIEQLVRALREDDSGDDTGTVEPPVGLAALDALIERHRSAGLAVAVGERGRRRPLAPAVDQAAYRILQEALTNAARHGDGSVEVEIAFGESALELSVRNPTNVGRAPSGTAHGLVGMRERAALLGGTVEAGASDGVFRVRAVLPYGGDER